MNSAPAPGTARVIARGTSDITPLSGWDLDETRGGAPAAAAATVEQQYWFMLGRRAAGEAEQRRGDLQLQQIAGQLAQLRQELAAAREMGDRADGRWFPGLFRRANSAPPAAADNAPAAPAAIAYSNGGLAPLRPHANPQPEKVVAVATLGIGVDELARIAGMVGGQMAGGRLLPIVLTDSDRLEIFRQHRLPLEYFPPAALRRRFAPERNWDLYIRRRVEIICRKWRPGAMIVFGDGSGLLIEAAKELGLMPS